MVKLINSWLNLAWHSGGTSSSQDFMPTPATGCHSKFHILWRKSWFLSTHFSTKECQIRTHPPSHCKKYVCLLLCQVSIITEHVLYYWEIVDAHHLLQPSLQRLTSSVDAADGSAVPSTVVSNDGSRRMLRGRQGDEADASAAAPSTVSNGNSRRMSRGCQGDDCPTREVIGCWLFVGWVKVEVSDACSFRL